MFLGGDDFADHEIGKRIWTPIRLRRTSPRA